MRHYQIINSSKIEFSIWLNFQRLNAADVFQIAIFC